METGLILEAELDLAGHHVDDLNCLSGSEAHHRTFAPFQAADSRLHKGA